MRRYAAALMLKFRAADDAADAMRLLAPSFTRRALLMPADDAIDDAAMPMPLDADFFRC